MFDFDTKRTHIWPKLSYRVAPLLNKFIICMYRDEFLTCGYDGYVIMWDAVAHIDLWAVHLNGQVNKIQVRIYPKQKYLPPWKKVQ